HKVGDLRVGVREGREIGGDGVEGDGGDGGGGGGVRRVMREGVGVVEGEEVRGGWVEEEVRELGVERGVEVELERD
ncbi:hypothetical protein MU719_29175, partial [Pseudomonas aeruginosa]|uniref:hypothetical protein n=1 Tax=Pseudomonas aeruginosa TaxID=287 RepID=UPI0024BE383F